MVSRQSCRTEPCHAWNHVRVFSQASTCQMSGCSPLKAILYLFSEALDEEERSGGEGVAYMVYFQACFLAILYVRARSSS